MKRDKSIIAASFILVFWTIVFFVGSAIKTEPLSTMGLIGIGMCLGFMIGEVANRK